MVVTTDEIDRYSEKKLRQSASMNGRIFNPMRSFSLHGGFSDTFLVCSALSSVEESTVVYLIAARSSPFEPFTKYSLSSRAYITNIRKGKGIVIMMVVLGELQLHAVRPEKMKDV